MRRQPRCGGRQEILAIGRLAMHTPFVSSIRGKWEAGLLERASSRTRHGGFDMGCECSINAPFMRYWGVMSAYYY